MRGLSPVRPAPPLVLVADDDRLLRQQARQALEADGYAVCEAADGVEALACFESRQPDLALVDVVMPRLDGFLVCRELRARHPGRPVPILVMTAFDDAGAIERAYEMGATDTIAKPLPWALLSRRIRFLLRTSQDLEELQAHRASLADAQRIARLGSLEWDSPGGAMRWSDELFRILGLDPREVEPNPESFFGGIHPEDRDPARIALERALALARPFQIELRLRRPDGALRFAQLQGEVAVDPRQGGTRLRGILQDLTEQRHAQERIRYLADYDSLTGLANRRFFRERLERSLESARQSSASLALLYLDLDGFKRVNDSMGHDAGDQLLRSVARRLRDHVRAVDLVARAEQRMSSAVSRLGGDEFTVLLPRIASADAAGDVARRILRALAEPIVVSGREVCATASIGIAVFPCDGEDAETLLKHADRALYHAKTQGKNGFQFFSESLNQASLRKLALESGLREALARDELRLHYQPRVEIPGGRVVGMEALLRWRHPELGVISPREFIPIGEETGLICAIGEWALRAACRQNRTWQEAGLADLRVSVNVSGRQLAQKSLGELVSSTLRETGLDPRQLEIEITESAQLRQDGGIPLVLRDLRAIGVSVALDDFGTGYSSLAYLTRLPLDALKIDRFFVRDMHTDPAAAGIARAVIGMARSIGVRAVAEGVDCREQLALLREFGCDEAQGFLVSGALPPEEFARFLVSGSGAQESPAVP
jgi:diguanylate cyclase (GGDEF)-like protein